MQGKGGVGKTLVSSVLAQYYLQNGCISAIDTDPVNKSFCNFKKFNAFSLPYAGNESKKRLIFEYCFACAL